MRRYNKNSEGFSGGWPPVPAISTRALKHVPLTLETFVGAHDQGDLKENDRLLVHRWHGQYGDGESWVDRDFWVSVASVNAELVSSIAGYEKEKPTCDSIRNCFSLPSRGKMIRICPSRSAWKAITASRLP